MSCGLRVGTDPGLESTWSTLHSTRRLRVLLALAKPTKRKLARSRPLYHLDDAAASVQVWGTNEVMSLPEPDTLVAEYQGFAELNSVVSQVFEVYNLL